MGNMWSPFNPITFSLHLKVLSSLSLCFLLSFLSRFFSTSFCHCVCHGWGPPVIISLSIDQGSLITTKHWNQLRRRRWYIFWRRRWMDLLRSDIDLLRSTSDLSRSTQIWLDIRLSPSISSLFFFSLCYTLLFFCSNGENFRILNKQFSSFSYRRWKL